MDFGYKAEEILWLVESGVLTLGYQSSSYLTDRVPELELRRSAVPVRATTTRRAARWTARSAGGSSRRSRARRISASSAGTRTASATSPTACAPIRMPADLKGIAHPRAAEPDPEAHLRASRRHADDHGPHRRHPHDQGRRDRRPGKPAHQHRHLRRAQVPPLPHHQQSFLHLAADLPAPADVRRLARRPEGRRCRRRSPDSVAFQRELHVKEEEDAERAIKAEGCEIVTLDAGSTTPSPRRSSRSTPRRGSSSATSCSSWLKS